MEFLFNSTNLTDVGCTMRLVRRDALSRIERQFTIGGSAFGPEMMLLSLLAGLRMIQVPVNYLPRIGESSVTGDSVKAIRLGLAMIGLVSQVSNSLLFVGNRAQDAHPKQCGAYRGR